MYLESLGEINTSVHQAGMQLVEMWAQMSFWMVKAVNEKNYIASNWHAC